MSEDLIVTARRLALASPKRPRQADLRRAVSTAYYALFHALAKEAADLLIGAGPLRAEKAWVHTYRALEHGFAKNACKEVNKIGFPPGIELCANTFVELQEERHRADYDPQARFSRAKALEWVARAEAATRELRAEPRRDRKAFAVQLLLKKRP